MRASTEFDLGGVQTVARGMLGWQHAFGDTDPRSNHRFATGDAFTVAGVPIAENVALIEAGLDFKVSPSGTLGFSYVGQFGSDAQENGFNARLKLQF